MKISVKLPRALMHGVKAHPLKAFGLLLLATVLSNALSLWLLGRTLEPWGWFLRGLLLGLGLVCLSHSGNWNDLQEGSFSYRWLRKR